ncbi:MAG: ABC-F family ATP-binding cassette domain-containing protein [Phycisphaerales bacterium]|nr:ABC-F family ATP-binding cassette domain-containing protein [Phycisphaerales bacterium]
MGVIRVDNVTRQYGPRLVLDGLSLDLHPGETVGIIGPNGAGKTTLFRLIAGLEHPDMGTVTRSKGLRVGYLSQDPQVDPNATIHDEVAAAFTDLLDIERKMHAVSDDMATAEGDELARLMDELAELQTKFEAAGGHEIETRLREVIGGLGFSERDLEQRVGTLSGGQKCRVALGRMLLQNSTYLLLDEPTNHLDIDAVRWLEKFLASHTGGAAIISHDRYLLDRLADKIVEVDRGKAQVFPGSYTDYVDIRERRALTQERQFVQDRAFIEKERAYIAKHLAGQRSKQAIGRRRRLERMLDEGAFTVERPSERASLKLEFDENATAGRTLLEAVGVSKAYGDRELFSELDVQVSSGERVGITGPNGAGKSTLLKTLVGLIEPDTGKARRDPKAVIGWYSQDASDLKPANRLLDEILLARPEFSDEQARSAAARFLFRGEDVFKPVSALSGGEQSRLRLLKLVLQGPNILVMDEPTNHLDIASREALEDALDEYPGTIVTVSHDRYFLDKIATRMLAIRDGQTRSLLGNYSDYVALIEREQREAAAVTARAAEAVSRRKNERPGRVTGATPRSKYDKIPISDLEAGIMRDEERLSQLNERFGDPEVYKDAEAMAALQAEYDTLKLELAEAHRAWETRVEQG